MSRRGISMFSVACACSVLAVLGIVAFIGWPATQEAAPMTVRDGDERPPKPRELPGVPPGRPVGARKVSVETVAALDKIEVAPGEVVRLTVVLPRSRSVEVHGYTHEVYLVADYNKAENKFIPREPSYYRPRRAETDFKGLPANSVALNAAGYPFTVRNPRQQGYEFDFTATHLGIFQITSEWFVRDGDNIQSQPVTLIARPPVDAEGKTIMEPGWVIE
jgi:hypothetical protein